ncbi:MAG TPA: hypothetical protein VD998_01695 [Verrucomicrobiae bacterium]|nr:hypothetical protein [Verrucomicrobiae bacterium]
MAKQKTETWIVLRNGRPVQDGENVKDGETQAVSAEQAINNVRFRLANGSRIALAKMPIQEFDAIQKSELVPATTQRRLPLRG